LTCADAQEVPDIRLILANKLIDEYPKFFDYRLGVGSESHSPAKPAGESLSI
jgi:hypothetical protein